MNRLQKWALLLVVVGLAAEIYSLRDPHITMNVQINLGPPVTPTPTLAPRLPLASLATATTVVSEPPLPCIPGLIYDDVDWSPDGKQLVFDQRATYDGGELMVMDSNGGNVRRLPTEDGATQHLARGWSPDGKLILYEAHYSGWKTALFVIKADGSSGPTRLTDGSGQDPVWSPDGQHILYVGETDPDWALFMVNPDGSGQTRLEGAPVSVWGFPTWSPDGVHIAFEGYPDYVGQLYLTDARGSRWQPVPGTVGSGSQPVWSPDGGLIAFTITDTDTWGIGLVDAAGGHLVRLADGFDASWSPDGQRIAYTELIDPDSGGRPHIIIMNRDGTGKTRLVDFPAGGSPLDWDPGVGQWQSLSWSHAAWSPGPAQAGDRRQIAFVGWGQDIVGQIYRVDVDANGAGTNLTPLTHQPDNPVNCP